MELNEIKKALYKEKPVAQELAADGIAMHYETSLANGQVVYFSVPFSDMGEYHFRREEPAHLLIRWITNQN